MFADDMVFASIDSKLQVVTRAVANKVNDLVGLTNYHLSDLFFGLTGAAHTTSSLTTLLSDEPSIYRVITGTFWGVGFSAYQIYRNEKLRKMDKNSQSQEGDAVAVDFTLMEEKRRFIGALHYVSGKRIYTYWILLDMAFSLIGNPVFLAKDLGLLTAQYFRETDYLKPNKKSRVIELVKAVSRPILQPGQIQPVRDNYEAKSLEKIAA